MKLLSRTSVFLLISLFIFIAPLKADDHYKMLSKDTPFVVTIHNTGELRDLWNMPEIKELLEISGVDFRKEFQLNKINAASQFVLGMTVDELMDKINGSITFAVTHVDYINKEIDPLFMIDFKDSPDTIKTIFDKMKTASELKDGEEGPQITHSVIGVRDVFTFEGKMSMTQIDNTLVFFKHLEEGYVWEPSESPMTKNPEFGFHNSMVQMDNGMSVYVNVKYFMDMIIAMQENPETSDKMVDTILVDILDLGHVHSASMRIPFSEDQDWRMLILAPDYNGIFADFFSNTPIRDNYFGSIHHGYDGTMAISIPNGKQIFDAVVERIEKATQWTSKESVYEEMEKAKVKSGVHPVNDILAHIGNHFGIGLTFSGDMGSVSLFNPLSIFRAMNYEFQIGVENESALIASINTLISNEKMNPKLIAEEYKGATIWSVDPEAGRRFFDFSMAIYKNRLYMGIYPLESMRMTIDRLDAGESMARFDEMVDTINSIDQNAFMVNASKPGYFGKYSDFAVKLVPGNGDMPEKYQALTDKIVANLKADTEAVYGYGMVRDNAFFGLSHFSVKSMLRIILLEAVKGAAIYETMTSQPEPDPDTTM